jgi:hypothetical protein
MTAGSGFWYLVQFFTGTFLLMISTSALILLYHNHSRPAVMLNERSEMKHPVRKSFLEEYSFKTRTFATLVKMKEVMRSF